MQEKDDRRSRKTQRAIQSALMSALTNKSISEIRVKALCEAADINRSTFYLHYTDVYDVLEQLENLAASHAISIFGQFRIGDIKHDPYPLIRLITEHLEEVPDFAKFLVGSWESLHFLSKIKNAVREKILAEYPKDGAGRPVFSLYCAATFAVSGFLDAYAEWLQAKKPVSRDQFCKIISAQIAGCLAAVLP